MGATGRFGWTLAVVASALATAVGLVPVVSEGADHLDAPALNPLTGAKRLSADINDLYVFQGADPSNTVLAGTYGPAAGAIGPATFGTDVIYQFNLVDIPTPTNFDVTADQAYRAIFDPPDASGNQPFALYKALGSSADGHTITPGNLFFSGMTNTSYDLPTGGKFFAGLRSDPFFFDLAAFQGTFGEQSNGRSFNDGMQSDFFEDLNVLALVLEIPDDQSPDASNDGFSTWLSTADRATGAQLDRMGRPAINTVVHSTGSLINAPADDKDSFNQAHPRDDATFQQAVEQALQILSGLDSEGPYDSSTIGTLVNVLLPDKLPYNKNVSPFGGFNGRRLEDDVIDIELNILTGGAPFTVPGRDNQGAVPTDGIGPHDDYLVAFPYLGEPHVAPAPDIGITKTPASQTVRPGDTATFTITVANVGNTPLSNVAVTDAASPSCAKSIGSLATGASSSYTCTAMGVTTSFTNVAGVTGQSPSQTVSATSAGANVLVSPAPPPPSPTPSPPRKTRLPSIASVDQDQGLWYLVDPVLADLSGDEEIPAGSGDLNSGGRAVMTFNERDGKICFDIEVANLQGNVTAAHIHEGRRGANGPVVVNFDWPNNGKDGCVDNIDQALIDRILADLQSFYVNVHSDRFPAGAVRGQLGGGPLPPFFFGNPLDDPFLGDWDGDGVATPGMYRPSDGKVYLRNSNTPGIADIEFFFGDPFDVPIIGDWDGDGDDTVGVYRPSQGKFFIHNQLGSGNRGLGAAELEFFFGDPFDDPIFGDFDGDGFDSVGVKRGDVFYWRNELSTGPADNPGLRFGDPSDDPLFGDWDGDGVETPGVYRPSTRTVLLRNLREPGIADMELFSDGFESGDTSAWSR